jgi:asparagine synthase (glutamine-hydrolysing)
MGRETHFKEILKNHFPDEFIHRPKMGFAIPLEHWFGADGAKKQLVSERLSEKGNLLDNYFQRDELTKIAKGSNSAQQWSMLFLQEWLQQNNHLDQ